MIRGPGCEANYMFLELNELTVAGQVEDPFENFGPWHTPPLDPNPGLVFLLQPG